MIMVNGMEEKLGVIQRQKAVLKKTMQEETDRTRMMQIALKIRELNIEEKEVLRSLGL